MWIFKSLMIFHKTVTNYRALLQKMTYEDKAFYRQDRHPQRPKMCIVKSLIIFHKIVTNYRALLQKITYKDKAFYRQDRHSQRCVSSSHLYQYFIFWSKSVLSSFSDVWCTYCLYGGGGGDMWKGYVCMRERCVCGKLDNIYVEGTYCLFLMYTYIIYIYRYIYIYIYTYI